MGQAADATIAAALERVRAGDAPGGLAVLESLARDGSVEAHMALVATHMQGGPVPRDPARAYQHLDAAAALGPMPSAELLLAACDRIGVGVEPDPDHAWTRLRRALAAGHAPSWRCYGALQALGGAVEAATEALRWAHAAGDRYAAHLLGLLALERGAKAEAAAWFDRNPALGVSRRRRAAIPDRPGALPSAPRAAPVLPDAAPWPNGRAAPTVEPRGGGEVRVRVAHRLLTPFECDHLITVAEPSMQRSLVVDPASARRHANPVRTSRGMSFASAFPDLVVHEAEQRMALAAEHPLERTEPLVSLHYAPGEEYRPHHDFLTPAALATPDVSALGQRVVTVVAYLNRVARGGGTAFPSLALEVAPEEGAAVVFCNARADGTPIEDSLHAGLPVMAGEKWVATLWCTDRPARRGSPGPSGSAA